MTQKDYQPQVSLALLVALILLLVSCITGCATSVPVTARFPDPPGKLATTACADLNKLSDTPTLSDVSRTVTNNYTQYYECAIKADAWIEWYNIQKIIFESAGKK